MPSTRRRPSANVICTPRAPRTGKAGEGSTMDVYGCSTCRLSTRRRAAHALGQVGGSRQRHTTPPSTDRLAGERADARREGEDDDAVVSPTSSSISSDRVAGAATVADEERKLQPHHRVVADTEHCRTNRGEIMVSK